MKNLYKIANYYKIKLARNNSGFAFESGDLVSYQGNIGRVLNSNQEITKVDFSDSFRAIPTSELEFVGELRDILNNEKELSQIFPVEIQGDYSPFTDDEKVFSKNIFLEENPIYFSRH